MPITRKLYTLGEVKEIIAKIENVDVGNVLIFECRELSLDDCFGTTQVDDDTYILQVDHAA